MLNASNVSFEGNYCLILTRGEIAVKGTIHTFFGSFLRNFFDPIYVSILEIIFFTQK
jgi:hypothetical protein